jgi:LmbE family N-acetylglucosaminyl deacetylase
MQTLEFSLASTAPLRLLCLGAHSDDIEIGCGGLILELLRGRRPVDVDWVVFSADAERQKEARRSAALFLRGARRHRIITKQFRDGFFPYEPAIKGVFEELKSSPSPDLVLTHFRDDRHQDHRVLSDLAWNTYRDHMILEYEIPKYDGDLGSPNCFVHLERRTCDRKIALLQKAFATQRGKHWFDPTTFLGLMRLRGMECRAASGYAEGFYARKTVLALR